MKKNISKKINHRFFQHFNIKRNTMPTFSKVAVATGQFWILVNSTDLFHVALLYILKLTYSHGICKKDSNRSVQIQNTYLSRQLKHFHRCAGLNATIQQSNKYPTSSQLSSAPVLWKFGRYGIIYRQMHIHSFIFPEESTTPLPLLIYDQKYCMVNKFNLTYKFFRLSRYCQWGVLLKKLIWGVSFSTPGQIFGTG